MKGILISRKEYIQLKKDSDKLERLKSWGVDNWSGYGECGMFDDRDVVYNQIVNEAIQKEKDYEETQHNV